ncbi:PspA/IM30 family protein [Peribacillus tepidiphilus]|uniref:PspA/IM30 family protein n=1 Tax=Peribacillus tepidiphilus TaxID=2652445 RepID=UPI0012914F5D|nr:PspA/IM30 family protein [Peribacillus tepidiphilus]
MKNLFTRIKNTISADLHEILDQKEQKNPIALLNQYLRECEAEAEKVRKLVERQYRLKAEFSREYQYAQAMAQKRSRQAEVALQAGEETLYEFALKEKQQFEEREVRLKDLLNQVAKSLEELEQKYEEMKHKLKNMHIKRMELMGRENIARANQKINAVLDSGSYSEKVFSRFDEIEQYMDRLEHQVNSAYYRSTIDAKIAQIEKEMKNKQMVSNS